MLLPMMTEKLDRGERKILRFNDELIHGVRHTKEHFDEMLDIVYDYEDYCQKHKKFPEWQVRPCHRQYQPRLR